MHLFIEFTSYKNIKPIQISLPNGYHVFSIFSGTIVFNKKLHLTDVLCVPQFAFNLISTLQPSLTIKCSLIFSFIHCLIQDNQTKEMIGLVDAKAGLYIF